MIDTNILLYAVNSSDPHHRAAKQFVQGAVHGNAPWCLTWPVAYEFLRVSTHHRVFPRPLRAADAQAYLDLLLDSPTLTMLSPTPRHNEVLKQTLAEIPQPAGNLFHDLATAVTLREHGVPEIATADTDFLQFKFLTVSNPLLGKR